MHIVGANDDKNILHSYEFMIYIAFVDNFGFQIISDGRTKFDRYRELTGKIELSDEEIEEMANIEMYLELEISSEYRRMKADFEKREDL